MNAVLHFLRVLCERKLTPASSLLLLALSTLLLSGCSPTLRLQVRFLFPASYAATLDSKLFHLSAAKVCPPGPLAPPKAGLDLQDAESFKSEVSGRAIATEVRFRGKSCSVQVTAWYDADGDGGVSTGDLSGTSVALHAEDRGSRGNLSAAPDVALVSLSGAGAGARAP